MSDVRPGYLSAQYAASFAAFGESLALPASGGWLLRRRIAGSDLHDAMGLYPVFCCREWHAVADDLAALRGQLVSLVLVSDPLASVEEATLARGFDFVRAYKDSYVVQSGRAPAEFVSKSHRDQARRALRHVDVELCTNPLAWLDEWERLYAVLADRHAIHGLKRFSRAAFAQQFMVPGLVMFRAIADGRTVGLDLWYVQDGVAQGHLAAFDETGYRLHAAYATKWTLLEYFRQRVEWINLGAGTKADGSDGLSYFKRGFATGTRRSWLCGAVFQPTAYAALCRQASAPADSAWFPAYRDHEFA